MIKTTKKANGFSSKLTIPSLVYQGLSRAVSGLPFTPSNQRYSVTICNERKFIWFRVAKVCTRSIFEICQQANLELDAEHPYSCHYPINFYQNYFKFAFVRNPWDRLVSCWNNKVIDSNHFNLSKAELDRMQEFENFVDYVAGFNLDKCDPHIQLQSKLIDLNNVDYIGRFESFTSDIGHVLNILGVEGIKIKKLNESINKSSYKNYYSDRLVEKVGRLYAKDISMFSYVF